MYRDIEGPTKPVEDLDEICHRIPIHLILGKVGDLMYVNVLSPFSNHAFPHILIFRQTYICP